MGIDTAVVSGEVKALFTIVSLTAAAVDLRLFMGRGAHSWPGLIKQTDRS